MLRTLKNFNWLILEREEGGEKHRFVAPPVYAVIGWFLHAPWPGMESATLGYQKDTPTYAQDLWYLLCLLSFTANKPSC